MSSQELCDKTHPQTAGAASPQGHSIRADWCGFGLRMALVKADAASLETEGNYLCIYIYENNGTWGNIKCLRPRERKHQRSSTNSADRGGRQDGNSSGGTHQGNRGKNGFRN